VTVGKLFQKILLSRALREVNERGLLRDEQFGFRPRQSTALQLGSLVERVNRNLDERRMTGAVFLDVAKAFDTVGVEGLLCKLTILNFPLYQVKTLSSYLHRPTFQTSFNSATTTRRNMRAGVAQCGLVFPVLFSLNVSDMPPPCRHVELALYADDTALIATSRSPLLLVSYLETYLNKPQLWLRDWRIATNVSKNTALLFAKTTRCIQRPCPVRLFGEPIQWVDKARYLGVTLRTRLTLSAHVNHLGRKAAQRLGVLGPPLTGRAVCPLRTACCSTSSSSVVLWTTHAQPGGPLPTPTSVSCRCCSPSVFALRLMHSGTLVTGKFTTICGFHSLPTTSEH
jgi:hypothetical protein